MTISKGAPDKFRGTVKNVTEHYLHVVSNAGNHEAIVSREDINIDKNPLCVIGTTGRIQQKRNKTLFEPDE